MKKILTLVLALLMAFSVTSFAEEFIDKDGMTASASSVWRDLNAASKAVDGKLDASWHSHPDDKDKFPVTLDVNFGSEKTVSGIRYYARVDAEGSINGVWTNFDVEISNDGVNFEKAVTGLSVSAVKEPQDVPFGKSVSAKYMRFTVNEGSKGYATCLELEFMKGDEAGAQTTAPAAAGTSVNKEAIKASASSVWRDLNAASKAVDGKTDTSWHSHPDDKDKFPVNFDIDFGNEVTLSGIVYHTRVDAEGNINGVWSDFDVEISKDGVNYEKAVTGLSANVQKEPQEILFGKNITARYVRFTINEGSKGYATCMELDFLEGEGQGEKPSGNISSAPAASEYVSKKDWKVYCSSSFAGKKAENMIDGNANTFWHSNYYTADNKTIDGKDEPPYYISFILPSETVISGFSYVPRQDAIDTGKVQAYEIYASSGKEGEAVKISEGELSVGKEEIKVDFGFSVKAQSIIFVIKESVSSFGTCAEFNLINGNASSAKAPSDVKIGDAKLKVGYGTAYGAEEVKKESEYYEDKNLWKIEASSQRLPHYPATKAIDGNESTYWHSDFTDDGGAKVVSMVKGPHTLDITFPDLRAVSGVTYTPRKGHSAGIITGYEIYAAESDNSEWIKIEEGSFKNDSAVKEVHFSANVKMKKLRFKSVTSVSDYGVCAELDVRPENKTLKTMESINEFVSYNKENKLIKIPETAIISADASSIWNENNGTNFLFDGAPSRAWHSSPGDKGKFPITLYLELDNVYEIPAMDYYARVDGEGNINGVWLSYSIWTSEDGEEYIPAAENLSFEITDKVQRVNFDVPLKAKFIEIEINEGSKGYATCGELVLYEKSGSMEDRKSSNYYTLQIGNNTVTSVKDGEESFKEIDVAPFIDDGRTMIPLRGLLEEMGAEITWDAAKKKIGITTDKVKIELQIMNDLCYVTDAKYGRVRYTLDVPPIIKDSRTFIPVRFITEQLGYKVTWDGETQTVKISE